jgi:hypothetical protein
LLIANLRKKLSLFHAGGWEASTTFSAKSAMQDELENTYDKCFEESGLTSCTCKPWAQALVPVARGAGPPVP